MNTSKMSESTVLRTFFIITLVCLVAWLLGVVGLWWLLGLAGVSLNLVGMIEALSTAVAAAAVFGAGFIAYRELSEVANSRHLDIADRLFDELNSPENIDARRWVFQNLSENLEEGIKNMNDEDRAAIKRVLNSLDRVAFLTQSGWIPDEVIMPWIHPMIAKSWVKLEPYVLYEREYRKEPYYYRFAGELAKRCTEWRKKNRITNEIDWMNDTL